MGKGEFTASLRLGRRRLSPLSVPGELFELYQPMIGPEAVMVWLNLRWLIQRGEQITEIETLLGQRFGMSFRDVNTALRVLIDFELLEYDEGGGYVVHEPLSADAFGLRFRQPEVNQPPLPAFAGGYRKPIATPPRPAERPAPMQPTPPPPAASSAPAPISQPQAPSPEPRSGKRAEPTASPRTPVEPSVAGQASAVGSPGVAETPSPPPASVPSASATAASNDLDAVVQMYHKRIGMIGPSQFEKLRFWVEERQMDAEVVALAIEETVASAKNPRINYLEGILRNWYNAGIRTLKDLMADQRHTQALVPKSERGKKAPQGVPNADAYRNVDEELVNRWKELYPDEYDE